MKRISSIDITRGAVMIIMALDHVRDIIHVDALTQSPTDLSTTIPSLFFTRLITYLCAPTFVFLAGTSAYLSFKKQGNLPEARNAMIKRGLWLILLEFTIVNLGIFFDPGFHALFFQVIAAIGFGFIVLGLLLKVSPKILGISGLVVIVSHNLFPLIPFNDGSLIKTILSPFMTLSVYPFSADRALIIAYPPIPWLGIMLLGYAIGHFFSFEIKRRRVLLLKIGSGALLLFILLRFLNWYGDPVAWSTQKSGIFTLLSFFNVTKYPPSLLFDCLTLGCMFLMLAFAEKAKGRVAGILNTYGKVPLFYFILHFYLIHVIMVLILFAQGFTWSQMSFLSGTFGRPKGAESGLSLGGVYLIWIIAVVLMYKPCEWFGRYKAANDYWWLKYV